MPLQINQAGTKLKTRALEVRFEKSHFLLGIKMMPKGSGLHVLTDCTGFAFKYSKITLRFILVLVCPITFELLEKPKHLIQYDMEILY